MLDAVALCERDDIELACWSLTGDETIPDDPRIAIAEPYRMVDPTIYAARLVACDVLALIFDPGGEMLATDAAADAIGLGMPALRSDWGYLVEQLGDAGIAGGHTVESVAAGIASITPAAMTTAQTAAEQRRIDLSWDGLAARTAALFERVVLDRR